MSSSTNVVITPIIPVHLAGTRSVNLGDVLGESGRTLFATQLHQLAEQKDSGWSRVDDHTYRVRVQRELPLGVPELSATVELWHGGMTVKDQWTYHGTGQAPQAIREMVQKLVNRAVNQPLVRVVANGVQERMEARLKQRLTQRTFAQERNSIQLHAQIRTGGRS